LQLRALRGCERHDADDRLTIDPKAIFDDIELAFELAGEFDNGRGGTGMESGAVHHSYSFLDHANSSVRRLDKKLENVLGKRLGG
jgi:hypothetical protein